MQHRNSGVVLQIVLSNDTQRSLDLTQKYMQRYPYLQPVFSVVKTMLDMRRLTEVYRGGIGSYPLLMMIVASFEFQSSKPKDAAEAFMSFLDFWGPFDTRNTGILLGTEVDPPQLVNKEACLDGTVVNITSIFHSS
jgi:non-canonical poly(A) RNA polymerase PAPD5/7